MLATIAQDDFSAGMWRSTARHLIDQRGSYDLVNLLLDNDGSAYKRGGSTYKSNAAFGAGLRWVWDGYLSVGQRTLFASSGGFAVLAADDATPVSLGGSGLTGPTRAAVVGGLLFIGGGTIYGGSRKAADYQLGTVTVTQNSTTVTGSSTSWTANVDAGMLLRIGGSDRYYVVKSVDSNTQITLTEPYTASTASGQAYTLTRLGLATTPYRQGSIYTAVANRLVECEGSRVYFSAGRDPATGFTRPHSFDATDYHEIPEGGQIIGAAAIRDNLLVFATNGIWLISNMAFDLTDESGNVEQRLQRVTSDIVLWSNEGVATWDNGLIVPALDGVWRVDDVSAPQRLSLSITKLYVSYVRAGYKTGSGVVYGNHYLLPILDQNNTPVDVLVCRLDRPISTRVGTVWPWTHLAGHAAAVSAFARRVGTTVRQPALLAAGTATTARVLDLSALFEPSASVKADADGTVPQWLVETRDYQTGSGESLNTVRRFRVRYELVDAATDNPTIQTYYSVGVLQQGSTEWGQFDWGQAPWADATLSEFVLASGSAPEDDGRDPFWWESPVRARFFRVRVQSAAPAASAVLRSIQVKVRQSGSGK